VGRDTTFLSIERRNHDAEKPILTDSLSNIVFAAAQHALAVVSLWWLFIPKLATQWHAASDPDKEWI